MPVDTQPASGRPSGFKKKRFIGPCGILIFQKGKVVAVGIPIDDGFPTRVDKGPTTLFNKQNILYHMYAFSWHILTVHRKQYFG